MTKRKLIFFLLTLTIISCRHHKIHTTNDLCWTGMIDNKIPVFLHFQIDDDVLSGKIYYLDTTDKPPITLIGIIEYDKSYKLYEFDDTGYISGMITGRAIDKNFTGTWESPKTKKEFSMALTLKDTLIKSQNIVPDRDQIFGSYHFLFGRYHGDLVVNSVDSKRIDFNILSFANVDGGSNMAVVKKDTIAMKNNGFDYTLPHSTDCSFNTRFYKGFAYVHYTNGICAAEFGEGASIDMLYLKVK